MTIDVAEGRRLKAAEEATAHAVLQSGAAAERVALWRARGACAQWLDANLATLLDAAERVEAAERERDEARIELRRMQAGELPGGWTEELNAAIEARHRAERELAEAREDSARLDWIALHGAGIREARNGRRNLVCWTDPDSMRVFIDAARAVDVARAAQTDAANGEGRDKG